MNKERARTDLERVRANTRARYLAFSRLAAIHSAEFAALLEEERAREGLLS